MFQLLEGKSYDQAFGRGKVATMGCRQSRAEGVQQIAQSEDPHSTGNLPCNLPGGPKTMKVNSFFGKAHDFSRDL